MRVQLWVTGTIAYRRNEVKSFAFAQQQLSCVAGTMHQLIYCFAERQNCLHRDNSSHLRVRYQFVTKISLHITTER